ncbi:MAG: hypothetical protein J6Y54_09550 [Lentisphaeria bacterium]|nr:hypothetical protein [Lentisphaeria bacterium]
MKKLLLIAGTLLLALGAWAENKAPAADDSLKLFDELVAGLKKNTPEDADVRADRDYRFIYLDLQMPVDSKAPFDLGEAKNGVLLYLRDSAELFKSLKLTVLVNFVTTDRRIRTVVVTPQDLERAAAHAAE